MTHEHDFDGHGGHTADCRACLIDALLAALGTACETRDGSVQVKFRDRWMLARELVREVKP